MKKIIVLFTCVMCMSGVASASCFSGLSATGDECPIVRQETPAPIRHIERQVVRIKAPSRQEDEDISYGKWAPFHFSTPLHPVKLEKI